MFNTSQGRKKARNLERDARVAVTVIDPDDQYNVVAFQGTVIDVTTDGADAHIDALAKKYLGVDTYPMRSADEVRIRVDGAHGPHRHGGLRPGPPERARLQPRPQAAAALTSLASSALESAFQSAQ